MKKNKKIVLLSVFTCIAVSFYLRNSTSFQSYFLNNYELYYIKKYCSSSSNKKLKIINRDIKLKRIFSKFSPYIDQVIFARELRASHARKALAYLDNKDNELYKHNLELLKRDMIFLDDKREPEEVIDQMRKVDEDICS